MNENELLNFICMLNNLYNQNIEFINKEKNNLYKNFNEDIIKDFEKLNRILKNYIVSIELGGTPYIQLEEWISLFDNILS